MAIIHETDTEAPLELAGGKGKGLLRLKALEQDMNRIYGVSSYAKVRVPPFLVIPPEENLDAAYAQIVEAAQERIGSLYAVRSSSPLEDVGENSFDGVFATYHNIGPDQLIDAVHRVRESVTADKARRYAADVHVDLTPRMPVIVQTMIANPNHTGMVYSRFPSPYPIVKIIRDLTGETERSVVALRRKELHDGSHRADAINPFMAPRSWNPTTSSDFQALSNLALFIEDRLAYPVIMEFADDLGGDASTFTIYPLQARRLTKLSDAKLSELPELQQDHLVCASEDVNTVGDVTGPALVITKYGDGHSSAFMGEYEAFDRAHPEGYVLVTPFIEFYSTSMDEATPGKKAVIAYTDLGRHHDLELARKRGILYLNAEGPLHYLLSQERRRLLHAREPIETGETIRIVSDGVRGFVFNLSR